MRRSGVRRTSSSVTRGTPEQRGTRDTTRGAVDAIVQPAVLRPHSLQRNDRRPGRRLKRSSCPAIRQRTRVGPMATMWQSTEPAWAIAATVAVTALADAFGQLRSIGLGGRPCHASAAVTQSSQSESRSLQGQLRRDAAPPSPGLDHGSLSRMRLFGCEQSGGAASCLSTSSELVDRPGDF